MNRRRYLAAGALALSGAAGCAGLGGSDGEDSDPGTGSSPPERTPATDESRSPPSSTSAPSGVPTSAPSSPTAARDTPWCPERDTDTPDPPTYPDATAVPHESMRFSITGGRDREYPEGVVEGPVDLFESREEATRILSFDEVDEDRREGVREFVTATDFERADLLYAYAFGPSLTYTDIRVASLAREESTLLGSVVMPSPCNPGDQMESRVSLVARAYADAAIERVRFAVVNGHGCLGRFAVDADDPNVDVLQNFEC